MLEFALGYTVAGRGRARAASLASSMAMGESSRQANLLEDLAERVDRQLLLIQALWALLEEQGYTEEQLVAKIKEIEAANPITGHASPVPADCPECGSKVAVGLTKCQICGTEVDQETYPIQD